MTLGKPTEVRRIWDPVAWRRYVPLIIWLLAAGASLRLFQTTRGRDTAAGEVEIRKYTVSGTETGRLLSVEVELQERVSAGQVVARLDTSMLEREIAVAEAELRALEAEVAARKAALDGEGMQGGRAFEGEVEEAEIEVERARSAYRRDASTMARIGNELALQRDLVTQHLTNRDRLSDLEQQYAALEQEVSVWPARIAKLSDHAENARRRLQAWRESDTGSTDERSEPEQLRPLGYQMETQGERIEMLRSRLRAMELRAPAESIVLEVLMRPGDVVRPGQPLITLVDAHPCQVVAYLEEHNDTRLRPGDRAVLRRRNGSSAPVGGWVCATGGAVMEIPSRFWSHARRPLWGKTVVIRVYPGLSLVPGEVVDIRFSQKPEPRPSKEGS